jgi:hypothetical protein
VLTLCHSPPRSHMEAGALQPVKAEPVDATAAGRQTRKRVRQAADDEDTVFDSDAEEGAEPGAGCRRGSTRRKGVAAKEQKKLNEKARRQRENDL